MGKKKIEIKNRSKTLPSSPTHSLSSSSSSSDFEFRTSISPRKSSATLCPADELFYKGQLLPLHLSPRISMVRTLLLASSSTSSSSDTTTTASRDSSSSNDSTTSSFANDLSLLAAGDPCCDSARPSSATDEDNNNNNNNNNHDDYYVKQCLTSSNNNNNNNPSKKSSSSSSSSSSKYFSLSRISNVFKKEPPPSTATNIKSNDGSSVKKMSSSAKEVIRKYYMKKVKPLYEKLSSSKQPLQPLKRRETLPPDSMMTTAVLEIKGSSATAATTEEISGLTQSFSGNLKCPRMIRRSYVASCPSSMRSSPSHSGVLTRAGLPMRAGLASYGSGSYSSDTSTMEELQNAIQGAIAHCKNSMVSSSSFNHININNNKGKGLEI
ncbi:probable membrane-associated kinase regulator 1 [Beta vulgaris subsp. vulgaris]|uniref:probable membrane-associated kinase regulator 1 n=1 Tax=Beta vulgaris subsp. vulgaris TaxID=3555 RepID=UPI002036F6EA|nr:probable membrane-associated kinase regulator 1 [Beta vulgaris subsp. vulgaris]